MSKVSLEIQEGTAFLAGTATSNASTPAESAFVPARGGRIAAVAQTGALEAADEITVELVAAEDDQGAEAEVVASTVATAEDTDPLTLIAEARDTALPDGKPYVAARVTASTNRVASAIAIATDLRYAP